MSRAEDRARDKARQIIFRRVMEPVVKANGWLTALGMPLSLWCGEGTYARRSLEDRDDAGRSALEALNTAITRLAEARDLLTDAMGPANDADAG